VWPAPAIRTTAIATTATAAHSQNSTWKSACWAMTPAIGNATAPPAPSSELSSAIPAPRRSGGRTLPMMLMPSGSAAIPVPCSARPAIITTALLVSAHTSDPASRPARAANSIRRRPNWSPSRPNSGLDIAAVSSVAVTSQDTVAAGACNSRGKLSISGITMVCTTDTAKPAKARAAITGQLRTAGLSAGVGARPVGAAVTGGSLEPRRCCRQFLSQ
jgi:hypothetical protein